MRKKIAILTIILGGLFLILVCSASNKTDPNKPETPTPPVSEPRKIVMPKETKSPVRYKCPVHGVTTITITMEYDGKKKVYCKKCALKLVSDFFDLNLPKLEVVK